MSGGDPWRHTLKGRDEQQTGTTDSIAVLSSVSDHQHGLSVNDGIESRRHTVK
jgi:hypothetical protein